MTSVHKVRVEPSGREITCRSDQPVLDACLRAGVWIPHSCTHGTCGTCKAQVLAGTVDHGDVSATTLMVEERAAGKLLLCTAMPTSDLVVEASTDLGVGLTLYPVRDLSARVASIEDIARDTRRLILALDDPLDFVAGQYVSLEVPGSGAKRAYSLANPPSVRDTIELHVRRTAGGIATDGWIFNGLQAEDRVALSGPFGGFLMRTDRPEPAIFIAGGTGLAPITSMIRHVLEGGFGQQLHLYQGARTRADLYDVDLFDDLAARFPEQFVYRPCLSEQEWEGAQGLVTDVLMEDFTRCRGYTAYACGPPPMVEAATKSLISLRIQSKDIYRENFYDQSDKMALSDT